MSSELVVFDLDKTLFRNNVSFSFYLYLVRKGIVPWKTLMHMTVLFLRFSCGFLSVRGLHHEVFQRVLKGLFLKDIEQAVDRFLVGCVDRYLRSGMLQRLQEAKQRGASICLLSSSAVFLVKKIANLLSFDRFIGTQYIIDKEGRLCHIASLITGFEKKVFAQQYVADMSVPLGGAVRTTVYSDSSDDLPLMEWADVAIAVSPDATLKRIAKLRKWMIL